MKEIFNLIKTEIPIFFSTFIKILSLPKSYPLQLLHKSGNNKEEAITRSLIYYFLCLVCCGLFITPIYGVEKQWKMLPFVNYTFLSVVFIFLAALAMKIAWRTVRCRGDYFEYFILLSYQIGTVLTIYLFLNFINLGILKYNNPENFELVIKYSYLNDKTVNPYQNILSDLSLQIFTIIGIVALISVVWWFYYGWRIFYINSGTNKVKSIGAMIVFSMLMVLVFFLGEAMNTLTS